MKRFMLVYVGPPAAPNASHDGWLEWFATLGHALLDRGSPLTPGCALHHDGSTAGAATQLNGFTLIQAENLDEARRLARDHPYLGQGRDHSVEVYSVP